MGGIVNSLQAQSNIVMKILLVLAVAAYAKAEAEADPGFVYSTGALPLAPALTYAYNPVVYTVPAAGCQNSEGAFVPCAQGNYFGYVPVAAAAAPAAAPAAEADAEADPWLYYSGLYGHGYGFGYAPLTYSHVYNHYGLGHYGLAYYGRKKRGAEPEATADPEADPWLLYGGYAGYGYHYAPYTYAAYHHPL